MSVACGMSQLVLANSVSLVGPWNEIGHLGRVHE